MIIFLFWSIVGIFGVFGIFVGFDMFFDELKHGFLMLCFGICTAFFAFYQIKNDAEKITNEAKGTNKAIVVNRKENKPTNNKTVVLFDNGNGKIDTLVFETDTIHADANNIW